MKKIKKIDTGEPIEFVETWHKDTDGFMIMRLTAVESGLVIDRKTPFKDIPWVINRWLSQEEVNAIKGS